MNMCSALITIKVTEHRCQQTTHRKAELSSCKITGYLLDYTILFLLIEMGQKGSNFKEHNFKKVLLDCLKLQRHSIRLLRYTSDSFSF